MSAGGFAVNPFTVTPAALDFMKHHSSPVFRFLAQHGGIVVERDGEWTFMPFTMLTFPG